MRTGVQPAPNVAEGYAEIAEGIRAIGHLEDSFHFDNERPVHRELVGPARIARALVTNGEWLAFMRDGGYARPELWLSDGWNTGYDRRVVGAGILARSGWCVAHVDAEQGCGLSTSQRRCVASVITKPTRSRAGREMSAERSGMGGCCTRRRDLERIRCGMAMDTQRPIHRIRGTWPRRVRSANTTANSWSIRWCCAAPRARNA